MMVAALAFLTLASLAFGDTIEALSVPGAGGTLDFTGTNALGSLSAQSGFQLTGVSISWRSATTVGSYSWSSSGASSWGATLSIKDPSWVTSLNISVKDPNGKVTTYSGFPEGPAFLDELLLCLVVGVVSFTMYRRRVVQQSQTITTA
ncbi:MAG TPA: hypothetical protein VK473_14510 [Terriglobales bacterium]|nr:hypothetical protein [Terriglobales bacterium]